MDLATKYRPNTLEDVVEQETVVRILRNECEEGLVNRNFLFTGPAGTGKAQPLDSLVLAVDGYKKMRDVKVGDKVFTSEGNTATVLGVYPQGNLPVYEVSTKYDFCTFRVAEGHLNEVFVKDSESRYSKRTVTTEELTDLVNSFPDSVFVGCPFVSWKHTEVSIPAYVVGAYLASGWVHSECVVLDLPNSCDSNVGDCLADFSRARDGADDESAVTYKSSCRDLKSELDNLTCHATRVPVQYVFNDDEVRKDFLRGVTCNAVSGHNDKGKITFTVRCRAVAESVVFLCRSLGLISYLECVPQLLGFTYRVTVYYLENLLDGSRMCLRAVDSVKFVGYEPCQCIYVDHEDHTYITDGFVPTHNTTLARCLANELNGSSKDVVEVDAASYSGVESMRQLIKQMQRYPLSGKYNMFIIDECVTGDVEILTNVGWKRMDSLQASDLVAQYVPEQACGHLELTAHWTPVHHKYTGTMYCMLLPWCSSPVMMTPHHVQPLALKKELYSMREEYVKDVQFGPDSMLVTGATGCGATGLTAFVRMCVSYLLCGSLDDNGTVRLRANSLNCVRLASMFLREQGVEYFVEACSDNVSYTVSFTKHSLADVQCLSDVVPCIVDCFTARQLLDFMCVWRSNGYRRLSFDSKEDADLVSAVVFQAGYTGRVREQDGKYCVSWVNVDMVPTTRVSKSVVKNWSGDVYCVKVPSHMVVLRYDGFAFVSGNCHALSNASWQAALKTLENPPARTVTCLCTTNPEKVPDTIVSRVQTFQLSKISLEGIQHRLEFILEQEGYSAGTGARSFDLDAVAYVSKLSKGGMRDAITLLTKVLAYSDNVSMDSVSSALNLPNYDKFFDLIGYLVRRDNRNIVLTVDEVYNSGVNVVEWFSEFHSFVCNLVKYICIKDVKRTMIPSVYESRVSKYGDAHLAVCLKWSQRLLDLVKDLKGTQYLQETAITYLCSNSAKKGQ